MRNFVSFVTIFVVASALAACAGGEVAVEGEEVSADPVIVADGEVGSSGLDDEGSLDGAGLDGDTTVDQALVDQTANLSQTVVYFEYDSSNLTPESEIIVQAHAQYLNSAVGTQVILEGHADERGTREYNLSLGEDRAQSVATLMRALGVNAGSIQALSYGEERPVVLGSDESSWSLNRRVEILY